MIVVTSVVCVYCLGLTFRVNVNIFKVFFICCVSVNVIKKLEMCKCKCKAM
jgi:hypothetical protein